MPKKHRYNRSSKTNIASIVQRLPLHRQMTQSQAALVKLSPTWLKWSANNLSSELTAQTQLTSLQNGQLLISCSNAVSASHIKHQQSSLLDSLKLNGFSNVTRIKIRIDHHNTAEPQPSLSEPQLGLSEPQPSQLEPQPGQLEPQPGQLEPQPGQSRNQTKPHHQLSTDTHSAAKLSNTNRTDIGRESPSPQTIKSIEHCQNLTSSDELAEALKRLAKTLKDLD